VDPGLKCNYLVANREGRVRRALSNSFGFGGSNCSLVLGAAP
jgi:3-oxoacyl-[acyl-carrier-protein] synthase-1